jgi:hypothetical protein
MQNCALEQYAHCPVCQKGGVIDIPIDELKDSTIYRKFEVEVNDNFFHDPANVRDDDPINYIID